MKELDYYINEKLKINSKTKINNDIKLIDNYPNNICAKYGDKAIEYLHENNVDISIKNILAIDLNPYYCMTLIFKDNLTEKFKNFKFKEHCYINTIENAHKRFKIDERYATYIDLSYKELNLKTPDKSEYLRIRDFNIN